eukprot:TRINITY_DN5184_c1_g1_i1.p2 TRINITY_DN5184_c1_g1~~TRINITY_DN5184_c1_g1_i1.p2  ORF type:complete len:120 (-),score=44.88 TRINITY_DN5184_c1_g1_i1:113-472(-)
MMKSIQVSNREAFMEIQNKMVETSRVLENVKTKSQLAERERRRTELTLNELNNTPENTTSYKSVGKMFMQAPLPELKKNLEEIAEKFSTDISKLQTQSKYLESTIAECEKNMDELVIKE